MKWRLQIFWQFFFFVVCAGISLYILNYRDKKINTPEVLMQKKVNSAIQKDLCERIEFDIKEFKRDPKTFTRTSVKTIDAETSAALRVILKSDGIPSYFPIEYKGLDGRFFRCKDAFQNWLEIPSASKITREEELAYMENSISESTKNQGGKMPVRSAAMRRIALVIGNGSYSASPLRNPVNDANAMASTLSTLGFEVFNLRDGNSRKMNQELGEFLSKIGKFDVALFYFSGHGIEYAGKNYLLPIDAKFNDPDEIPRMSLDVTKIIERLSRYEDKLSIVIVDACRSSPVRSTTRQFKVGLAEVSPLRGSLVGFSTGPGMLAEDGNDKVSPYTKHLMKNIIQKGVGIESVFKSTARDVEIETAGRQIPWYMSNLRVEFSLN
jgi:hypothetical protein